jgi:hypothetical protein
MLKLKVALSHFLHQRKAKSRHGLHSPFVYRLVDKVIYDFSNKKVYAEIEKRANTGKKLNKTDKLLYRILADAQPQTVWLLGEVKPTDEVIIKHAAAHILYRGLETMAQWNDTAVPNVIYLDARLNTQLITEYFNRVLPEMNADSLLIINNIQANTITQTAWKAIRLHKKVTASVTLFWMGLIYFREGQVKEDFLIKF